MRLFPIVGESDDLEDPKVEWRAYMRARWYDRFAGPSLLAGVAAGLNEPNFEFEWRTYVPPSELSEFVAPWRSGRRPPSFQPVELPVPPTLRTSDLIPTEAQERFDWLKLRGPEYIPLFVVPAAPTVTQIDPGTSLNGANPVLDLEALVHHRVSSAVTSLMNVGLPQSYSQSYSRTLALEARSVQGMLDRGAEIVRLGKRFVVKAGSALLGPVGLIGNAKDLWDFVQWTKGLDSPPRGRLPGGVYQPSSNSVEFTLADGSVFVYPVSELS